MEYILRTTDLTKIYSRKAAVNKVNLEIKKGDIYGFIGRNGAGKTTTIRMIVGLSKPTSGKIELFESGNLMQGRSRIGTVIEYPSVYPCMTAKQNMEAQRLFLGVSDKSVTDEILNVVGLSDTGKKKAKDFSLGMKQRLAIALALIGDPEFLFLDEPINGLDPMGIRDVRDLILRLNKEREITIMISSHILGELSKIATCYGVINNGELVDQFSTSELSERVRKSIRIKVNDTKRACNIITSEAGVNDYRIEDDGSISIFDSMEKVGDINSCLAQNSVIVESMTQEGNDYEEYFIKLMGGNQND